MRTSGLGQWAGFAIQIVAAGAAMIWPNDLWIGGALFVFGSTILAGSFAWYFRTNYRLRWPWISLVEVSAAKTTAAPQTAVISTPPGAAPKALAALLPEFDPIGLYTSSMQIDASKVTTTQSIEISINGFNATGHEIRPVLVAGRISWGSMRGDGSKIIDKLPAPSLMGDRVSIPNRSEFTITLEQWLTPQLADFLRKRVVKDLEAIFRFDDLKITIGSTQIVGLAMLPLWSGIRLYHDGSGLRSGRIQFEKWLTLMRAKRID
jgi:hypothetical protein